MLFADNQNEHDPAVNLAMEEYLLRHANTDEDLLLFYINEPSIIIGRHQNTLEEINRSHVESHGIHVVRRLSGGGAVYHDLGNLNFSFITPYQPEHFSNFKKFTEPVLRSLGRLGIQAELSGRNDILVDGRKISGNAQYITSRRMVSHGTLLFNADLSHVADALNVKPGKIVSKGIKSVRSRVANISEFLTQPLSIEAFRSLLLENIFDGLPEAPQYHLSAEDWRAIHVLAEDRYRSWNWNYGRSPDFNVQKVQRFDSGEIEARIDVQQGSIQTIKFYGDYFAEAEPEELEQLLVGVRYEPEDLARALQEVPLQRYFNGMDAQTFLAFLY